MNFKFVMQTIPHKHHRYPTIGDWKISSIFNTVKFTILASREIGPVYTFLIFIHELVESFLCYHNGVTDEQVTAWDIAHEDAYEPGEVAGAPYYDEHQKALVIEGLLMDFLKVDPVDYAAKLDSMFEDDK